MRRRRRCHYKGCTHHEAQPDQKDRKCTFYVFPKDNVRAQQWLSRSGITNLTPKRVTSFNCFICSCHFSSGKNGLPDEYIEEYDVDELSDQAHNLKRTFTHLKSNGSQPSSPLAKNHRGSILTPSTKLALEGLLSLTGKVEDMPERGNAPCPQMTPKALVKYSPRKRLWVERGSSVRKTARKSLQCLMDLTKLQAEVTLSSQQSSLDQSADIGAMPLPMCSTPLSMKSTFQGSIFMSQEESAIMDVVNNSPVPSINVCDINETHMKTLSNIKKSETTTLDGNNNFETADDNFLDSDGPFQTATDKTQPSPSDYYNTFEVDDPQGQPPLTTNTKDGVCGLCGNYRKEEHHRSIGIQCDRSFLCYQKAKQLPEEEFKFYTGLTQTTFQVLYTFLGGDALCTKLKYNYTSKTPKRIQFTGDLTAEDKLFMTLLRLRRGIPLRDLGVLFKISEGQASKIVYTWVRFMSLQFKFLENYMFTSAEAQDINKPKCFEKFPRLRGIIDATEFRIQKPKHFQQQSNTYSSYKSGNTVKFLICISCFGGLSYISEGEEGSISDRMLLVNSKILERMNAHEALMADRGFDAEDLFDERDLELIMPAFLGQRSHFTARELVINRAIAVSRIHVETFIGKIKEFRLVRYILPNSMLPIASDLVRVCAFLVNFQLPFVRNVDDDNQ